MTPTALRTKDKSLLHVLSIHNRAILFLLSQSRLIAGLLLVQAFAERATQPAKGALSERDSFKQALAEARAAASNSGDSPPALGAPHIPIFHTFVQELIKLEIGGSNKTCLANWLKSVEDTPEQEVPLYINLTCQHFSFHDLSNDQNSVRLQIALAPGDVKNAIMSSFLQIKCNFSSGPAPPGFFEEELAEWMSMLSL